jgi:hypothetical protein
VRVTPKAVFLEPFYGSTDQNAHTIDRQHFLPLMAWLKASRMKLAASRLAPELWVATMVSALKGAALSAFT